jgi:hypothetical protein
MRRSRRRIARHAHPAKKGRPEPGGDGPWSAESRRALLFHLVMYHLVMAAVPAVTTALLGLPVTWAGAGIAFPAVTHGFRDRRRPVEAWIILTGGEEFAKNPQGRYPVGQAQHILCLWTAASLIPLV